MKGIEETDLPRKRSFFGMFCRRCFGPTFFITRYTRKDGMIIKVCMKCSITMTLLGE